MRRTQSHTRIFIALAVVVMALFFLNIAVGPVGIPLKAVVQTLLGTSSGQPTWDFIILHYRLPKAITAALAGMGLSIAGLLMQTLFRNPLAGPDVLGLSSGSGLGVALLLMGSSFFPGFAMDFASAAYGVVVASIAGSFLVLLTVLLVAQKLRDTTSTLIVGLMFACFSSAIVGVLTYFSSAEQLQKFTFWALGSLANLPWPSVAILAASLLVGLVLAMISLKPLDSLLLGETYARSLGLDLKRARLIIILATSTLAGSVTAFAGPIAFVGLAVPHLARLLFATASHWVLFWATLLLGMGIVLVCDLLCQWPGSDTLLPINAVTSLIGAPVVVWLVLRKPFKF